MKIIGLIVLAFIVCSLVIVLFVQGIIWRDKTIFEHTIEDVCIVRIRAKSDWEISIPVYLVINKKSGKTLRSTAFSRYEPAMITSKELQLEIHEIDHIVFIHYKESPNWILAMVDLDDNFVFPSIGGYTYEEIKAYNAKIRTLFARLKGLLQNNALELAGYPVAPK